MQQILIQTASSNYEHEILLLTKVAKILKISDFSSMELETFSVNCQQDSIPTILKTFVAM